MPSIIDYMTVNINRLCCVRLPGDDIKTKPKFCVLLESWDNGKDDILITLVTSKVDKYCHRKDVITIKANTVGLPEDSLIHSGGLRTYSKLALTKHCKYISTLPNNLVDSIISKIAYAYVDFSLFIRARGITKFP